MIRPPAARPAAAFPPALPALLALCLSLAGGAGFAQEPDETREEGLRLALELEATLLAEDMEEHEGLARRRAQLEDRVVRIQTAMLEALRDEQRPADEIRGHLHDLEIAEGDRGAAVEQQRHLVQRILERRRKLELLAERLAAVDGTPRRAGVLTGTWTLTMLPSDQKGTFYLRQAGTLVSGTYVLDGGFSGSIEGTLIDRKVFLERIDSKLGRMMEFEGVLSADRKMIRGSWLNRELAGAESASGHWSAVRRDPPR